ncbi:MAG: polyphosphate polymerase domain-containing protein [Flavobacteriales bacterium]|nr:polyphosphate polymerase domain-containing protein [Flavobacteriales bacterium]MBK7553334.1 polyphosphate polymerase domain-containing protein [Flavobacteriales bacterium]MBK9194951.1 polyphosphate polymerase domain-containing protein [Flavobacteriales bacterium]MBP6573421.1 polyphosphate polymerase domain-containing protein [Flavobacteriales bacterium]
MRTTSDILGTYAPITLAEMDSVQLLNRTDTKYVFAESDLPNLLEMIAPHYRCLDVDGERGTSYRSLYFDRPDDKSYFDHHNGRTFRSKVRFREYMGSGLCFLEVKRKTGRGRTDKARRKTTAIPLALDADQAAYVEEKSGMSGPFEAKLWNYFTRVTLVNRTCPERLTIDHSLRFTSPNGERSLDGICIAELKQERVDRSSPFVQAMRTLGYRPTGMSKYCIGAVLLRTDLKHNTFNEVLRKLDGLRSAA